MTTVTVGEKIKVLRKERGWTQGDLAEKIGVKPQNISRYEKDRVQPRESTLALFAEVFEMPVSEFTSLAVPTEFSNLDPEIADYVRLIPTLSEKDQFVIKRVLKALINEKKVQKLFAS
jgi:transcriptional regulator with XRE-family HTH domain